MKWILFDLAVLASFVTAAIKLLLSGARGAEPDCPSDVSGSRSRIGQKTSPRRTDARHDVVLDRNRTAPVAPFEAGDTVEVFDPRIHESLAFFAKIERIVFRDDGSVAYDVRGGPNGTEAVLDVDHSNVRSHEHYQMNTPVMCDFGSSLTKDPHLRPCAIITKNSYSNSYYLTTLADGKCSEWPVSRIRRVMDVSSYPEGHFAPRKSTPNDLRGMVELYSGQLGVPAILTSCGPNYQESVRLKDTFTGIHQQDVNRKFVHPYQAYAKGTKAMCNVGGDMSLVDPFECRIQSHFVEPRSGIVQYHVSYVDRKGREIIRELSSTRVQRHLQ